MNKYKKQLKNNSGAVSVQAIFMMLVMVTLGAFAITSARVNYTFSMKSLEWNRMYYALEDKAEHYVGEVDRLLKETAAEMPEPEIFLPAASERLGMLSVIYPGNSVYFTDGELFTEINFISDINDMANLRVVLRINDNEAGGSKLYTVREWVQWQAQPEDAGGMSLWDGIF